MRSLFRSLEAGRVRYLVISGQASVLYGAALFSQDLDLWVDPAPSNIRALLRALARVKARAHRLTPPLTTRNLARGHGFHFMIPERGAFSLHLDVMGRPPRVGPFAASSRRAEIMPSSWGEVPVVSIEDLVELKKTNRPADYEVITRLALIRLAREDRPRSSVLSWALRNIFRAEDLWNVIQAQGSWIRRVHLEDSPAARPLHAVWSRGGHPTLKHLSRAARLLSQATSALQDKGRAYWLPIIDELRRMRSEGKLLPEGMPVRELTGRSRA